MKSSRKLKSNRKRRSHSNRKRNMTGGESYLGIRPKVEPVPTLERLGNYWYNNLGRQCWYSDGQTGYYFTNLKNDYMSTTHTHIYKIDDLDNTRDGPKQIHYTTKKDNVHVEQQVTVNLNYLQISDWLFAKNTSLR